MSLVTPCLALALILAPGLALACALKLVLALDASASVDPYEHRLQRQGIAAAFRDAEVQVAIAALGGPLWVTVTHWSAPDQQAISVPWQQVTGAVDAVALAARIDKIAPPFSGRSTAIGNALRHAGAVLATAPACRRSVVDLSGDGPANTGTEVRAEADALAATGVTVNGLLILVNPSHFPEGGVPYFLANVVRGPASFVVTTERWERYPEAFRRKLLRELSPQIALR